jgi:hypothetical protein
MHKNDTTHESTLLQKLQVTVLKNTLSCSKDQPAKVAKQSKLNEKIVLSSEAKATKAFIGKAVARSTLLVSTSHMMDTPSSTQSLMITPLSALFATPTRSTKPSIVSIYSLLTFGFHRIFFFLYHTYIYSCLNIHTHHLASVFLPSRQIVPCKLYTRNVFLKCVCHTW